MKRYRKQETIKHVLECVICDICERSYDLRSDAMEAQEFISINIVGGYNSIFGDGNDVLIDMCQHCFKDKLGEYIKIEENNKW